jgi:hypothetical protein
MTIRLLAAALLALLALPANAGTVQVKNCSGDSVRVYSYNSDDTIYFASFAEVAIDKGRTENISCRTDACKLKVEYGGSSNNGWMNYVYSWGVCARGPWNAELTPIERCTC